MKYMKGVYSLVSSLCMIHSRFAVVLALLALWTGSVSALLADYVACDAEPTIPITKLCWDTVLNVVRPNASLVLLGNRACCPLNVTAPMTIPQGDAVYLGMPQGGAPEAHVQGTLRIETGASVHATTTNLTVHGDLIIASGAHVHVTESNATRTFIIVEGCLLFEAPYNDTTLAVELAVADGNQSRSYAIFVVPSGCINGSFGNVTTDYVLAAGQNDLVPPLGLQCLQSAGLALLVDMVCASGPAPTASTTTITTTLLGNGTASSSAAIEQPGGMNTTLWWIIGGVLVLGILAAVIVAIVLVRLKKTRQALFPYRDRPHFHPSVASPSAERSALPRHS